ITTNELQWFILCIVFAIYIAMRFSLDEQLQIFTWFISLVGVLSLMAVFLFPANGIHTAGTHSGLWRGIFIQKNHLSMFSAAGAVVVIMLGDKMGRWRYFFGAILVVLTFGARSGTGILAMVAMFIVVPQLQVLRLRHQWMIGLVLILVPMALAAAIILAGNFDALLGSVGKDATLTGRTELWNASFVLIEERTALGWGWRASFAPSSPIHQMITWSAPFAHNHWIDMTLDVGMIGSFLYMVGLILFVLRALVYAQNQGTKESLFPLVFVIIIHIMVLSTQALMTLYDGLTIFYVSLTFGLAIQGTKLIKQPYRMAFRREKYQEELEDPTKYIKRRYR
ncbi:MAG: O-antigen ligase family protein, partial [Anaerolineae bacterium]|nr:O-antigen ligase family protein [Anaerolineae bacterium]